MQNPQEFFVAEYPVGIESRACHLISKLRLSDPVFSMVAIFGISGSGKTTLVKSVYNRIAADFDITCFIQNISYKTKGPLWEIGLQKEVIYHLTRTAESGYYNDPVKKIESLIASRKVLLVLDDVDKFKQLQALCIHRASFDHGSRVIVTTRDKQSLGTLPYTPYEISLLNETESFELFTRIAFGKDEPIDKKFVAEVVFRAGGLPLVLEVWGLHFKCHERKRWQSVLETLKRIPHEDVQKKLQVSYDSLSDRAKKLFLDIACFFAYKRKDLIVKVLQDEDSAFYIDNEIQYLVDKGLVKINEHSQVSIRHVIQEMGKEVVRQENESEPGQRTRLTDRRDVVRVLTECSGTKSIEGIRLNGYDLKADVSVQVEAIKKMSNLRVIQLYSHLIWSSSSSNDDDMPSFSFKKLKYLSWSGFPFKCIDIDMANVVVIHLHFSKLEILWEGVQNLKKLRTLDVSYSDSLTRTGSFSGLEKLEELRLCNCDNLEELDSSIGCLDKLTILDLGGCTRLKRFPWEMIGNLRSLSYLNLSYCSNIGLEDDEVSDLFHISDEFGYEISSPPEEKTIDLTGCANLKSIPYLPPNIEAVIAEGCESLISLPSNMSQLGCITKLELDRCSKLGSEGLMKVTGLRNLRYLRMSDCSVSHVPSEIGNLVSLEELHLSGNTFSSLPDSFSNLSRLVNLEMNDCFELRLLPLLPSSLRKIEAHGCGSLDVIHFDSMQMAYTFRSKMFKESSPFTQQLSITLSGEEEVPDWRSYVTKGHCLSFAAPIHLDNKICGIILFATIKEFKFKGDLFITCNMLNKTKKISGSFFTWYSSDCYTHVLFTPLDVTTLVVEAGDTVEVQFFVDKDPSLIDSSCGFRLIYEGDVADSAIVLRRLIEPTLSVPSSETSAIITPQFNDLSVESHHQEASTDDFFNDNPIPLSLDLCL